MLFSGENKNNTISLSSTDFARATEVNITNFIGESYYYLLLTTATVSSFSRAAQATWSVNWEYHSTVLGLHVLARIVNPWKKNKRTMVVLYALLCWKVGHWLSWGLMTRQSLWVILCHLPEKGRNEIEDIVEEKGRKRNKNESEETEKI